MSAPPFIRFKATIPATTGPAPRSWFATPAPLPMRPHAVATRPGLPAPPTRFGPQAPLQEKRQIAAWRLGPPAPPTRFGAPAPLQEKPQTATARSCPPTPPIAWPPSPGQSAAPVGKPGIGSSAQRKASAAVEPNAVRFLPAPAPPQRRGPRATQTIIQRQIDPRDPRGPRGDDLIERYVRSDHGEMGQIVDYHAGTNTYCIAIPPSIDEEFFVVGTDPYWRVVARESAPYLWNEARRQKPKGMLTLKSDLMQPENIIKYEVRDGKMYGSDGQLLNPASETTSSPNVVSFVLTRDLNLLIGYGHTGLSKGHTVVAAGILKIVNGEASYHGNVSGHYFPQGLEEVRGIKYVHRHYPWIKFPRNAIGVHLPDNLTVGEGEARQSMIDILLSSDKEKRKEMKKIWPRGLTM